MSSRPAPRMQLGLRALLSLAMVALTVSVIQVADVATAPKADAVVAPGGVGRFRDAVEWIPWGAEGTTIPNAGTTGSTTRTVGGLPLVTTCTVGTVTSSLGKSPALNVYSPGAFRLDTFDDLYNSGATDVDNTLDVGLRNINGTDVVSFPVNCSAKLNGTPVPLGGLVIGDAESLRDPSEYISATPVQAGATWRVIDRFNTNGCTNNVNATRDANNKITMAVPRMECGTSADLLADGATGANITVRGYGQQAVAIGVVLPVDSGDAPATYGDASHLENYTFTGGTVPVGTTPTNISSGFALAGITQPTPRLGAVVDPNNIFTPSADASSDDAGGNAAFGGPDDEDAVTVPNPLSTTIGGVVTQGVACVGAAPVAGWLDFNGDGDFADAGERSTNTPTCNNTSVSLTWTVPAAATSGASFLRVRTATATASLNSPTGAAVDGEAEDHPVNLAVGRPPLACANIFALQGAAPRNVWQINPANGLVATSGSLFGSLAGVDDATALNGLGLSSGGDRLYGVVDSAADATVKLVYEINRTTGVKARVGAVTVPAATFVSATHGAVNPRTGVYYFGGINGTTLSVYGYNTVTGASLGLVASGTVPVAATVGNVAGANGDFAFDNQNNLYLTVSGATRAYVLGVNEQLPTAAVATPTTLTNRTIVTINDANSTTTIANGLAAGGQGDRRLYVAGANNIRTINPSTGAIEATQTFNGAATTGSVDLASCSSPNTIEAQASFPDGRVATGDQATVTITGGGIATNNTGTTAGADAGVQGTPAETAGTDFGLDGTVYTATQTGITTPDYRTTYTCTDLNTNTVLTSGTGRVATFTMPGNTGSAGTAAYCLFTNTILVPKISLSKSAGTPTGATAGSTVPYSFVVTNTGNVDLSSVSVNDPKIAGVTCPTGTLAVGASRTCTGTYTLTQADVDAGQVVNTATATGVSAVTGLTAPNATATAGNTLAITRTPALTVTKTATPATGSDGRLNAGDTISYSFSVKNTGNTTLSAVAVTDPKVAGITCTPTTLAPNATATCTTSATYKVTQADVDAGKVVNTATATATPAGGGAQVSGTTMLTTPTSTTSSLVATFSPPPVQNTGTDGVLGVGDTIAYTYTVTNNGDVTVTKVDVGDTILGTPTCAASAASLAPGASTTCTVTYTVTQADVDAGGVSDTITPAGTPATGGTLGTATPASSTISTATASAVQVNLTAVPAAGTDKRLNAGDAVTYTVTVTNVGTTTLTNPVVTLPGFTVTCPTGALAPNGTVTCTVTGGPHTVTQAEVDAGSVVNTASVTATGPAGAKPTDTDTATTPTSTTSSLVATFAPAPVLNLGTDNKLGADDTIDYTYTITNNGDVTVKTVNVTDTIAGTPTCAASAASLAPGASTTCTVTYTVTQADVDKGSVDDLVTPTGTPAIGGALGSATPATSSIPTNAAASAIAVTLTPVPAPGADNRLNAGDTVGYAVSVTNTGTTTLTAPLVSLPGFTVSCPAAPLAPGATVTCTVTGSHTVTQAEVDAGTVANTASVTATPQTGAKPTNTATATTPTSKASSLVATFDPDPVTRPGVDNVLGVGDKIDYTYTITNNGDVTVKTVNVTDTIAGTPTCAGSAASLAPGASTTCTVSYTVTQADVDRGSVTDVVTPTGTPVIGGTLGTATPATSSVPTSATTSVVQVDLTAVPAPGTDGRLQAGDTVTYTVTVKNTGTTTLTAPVVTLPGFTVTCDQGPLAPGATLTCTVSGSPHTVTQAEVDAGTVVNTASVTATGPAGTTVQPTDTDTATTPTSTTSGLVATFAPDPVQNSGADGRLGVGETIDYTYTITNDGDVTVKTVNVTDNIAGTPTCAGSAASLAPGASTTCTVTYTVTQADVDKGSVDVLVTPTGTPVVGGALGHATPATSSISTTATASAVSVTLTAVPAPGDDNRLNADDTVGYTVTVQNTGTTTLTDPVVTLPGFTVTCDQGPLAPGATLTCTVSGSPHTVTQDEVDAGAVVNTATVTATPPAGVTTRPTNTSTATTPTSGISSLVATFSPDPVTHPGADDVLGVGETIDYTYTITNNGDVSVTGVGVGDTIDGTPTCADPAATLAPGASTTCTVTYTVTQADVDRGSVTDVVTPTGTPVIGGTLGSATSATSSVPTTATTSVVQVDLTAVPAPGTDGRLQAGDTVTYTVTVRNTGTTTLTDPAVTLPGFTVLCPSGPLAPNGNVVCTVDGSHTVTQDEVDAGTVVNTATVTATPPAGARPTDTDTATTPTSKTSGLVATFAPDPVQNLGGDNRLGVGDTIDYTYTITNDGDVTVTTVDVTDTITGTPVCATSAASLTPGASTTCTVTYTVTQADVDKGSVDDVVTPTGTPVSGGALGHATPATSSIPTTASASAVSVTLTAVPAPGDDNRLNAGDTVGYTVLVTNTGTTTLTAPLVDLSLPGLTVACPAAALAPGASVTCVVTGSHTVTQAEVDAGAVVDTADVSATGPAGTTTRPTNTATATTPTSRISSLVVTFSPPPTTAPGTDGVLGVGDKITYTYTVVNNGDVSVTGVGVDDSVPGTPTCAASAASVAPGASTTCTFVYTITQADVDAGSVTDVALPTGTPATGGQLGNATSATSAIPTTATDSTVQVDLTAVPAPGSDKRLNTGDLVTYAVTVTNTGTTDLIDPMVTLPGFTVTCPTGQLAPKAAVTCAVEGTHTVTQAEVDAGAVVNTATVTATGPGDVKPTDTDTATTPTSKSSSLVVTFDPAPVISAGSDGRLGVGDTVTYTYTVTNNGDITVNGVGVDDSLPGTPNCAKSAAAVAPGESTTCTFVYTVTQADVDKGSVDDVAIPTGTPATGGQLGSTTSATSSIPTNAAISAVSVTLTAKPAAGDDKRLNADDLVGYAVTVTNTGTTTLTDPVVTLPGFTVTCDQGPLAPGATLTCTVDGSHVVTQDEVDAGAVVNTAYVSATGPAGTTTQPTNTATATTPTSKLSSLVVTITPPPVVDPGADGIVGVGDTITYTYTVVNNGDVSVTGVGVDDSIPGTPTCATSAASVAPGESTTCTFDYKITQADVDKGSVTDVAVPTGTPVTGGQLGTATPATSSVPVSGSSSTIQVDLAAQPDPGGDTRLNADDQVGYTVTVTNTGTTDLTDPVVTLSLPGLTVRCPGGVLIPKASVTCTVDGTYTVTQDDVDAGTVVNTATVTATAPAGTTTSPTDSDTATTPTSNDSSLAVTIDSTTPPGTKLSVGDVVTYTYTVTNDGDITVDNVSVGDSIPGTPTCSGSLAPGATTTCTVTYTVTQADVDKGSVDDLATPAGTPATGGQLGTATSATSSIPTATAAAISVTLTPVPAPGTDTRLNAGDTVGYRVTVKNTGTTTLTDPVVTLPGFTVTCDPGPLVPGASVTCTVTGSTPVTQADVDAGGITNTATVTATPPAGITTKPTDTATVTTPTSTRSVLVVTFDPAPVTRPGPDGQLGVDDTIVYTYTVTNNGDVSVTGVGVADTTDGTPTCADSAATLAPGASTTCTVTYKVTQGDVDAGAVGNTVTPTGTPATGGTLDVATPATSTISTTSTSTVAVTLTAVPDLGDDSRLNAGDTVSYTVAVQNTGTTTLTDPTVSLPGFTVVCPTGPVAPGASVTCTVTGGPHKVTQAEVDAGTLSDTATVTATTPDDLQVTGTTTLDTPTSTVTRVAVEIAVLSVTDPDNNGTEAGDQITYGYTVFNSGDVTLYDPTVTTGLGLTVSCPPGPVVPGGSVTCTVSGPYTVTQADVNAGSVTNTATATGTPPTGAAVTSAQEAVITQTTTTAAVAVTVAGVVADNDNNGTDAGDVITYTYTVTNNGTVPLTGVGVVDSIPGDPVCQATTLAPGASTTCTATYTITQADVDAGLGVSDQVTVSGTPPTGPAVTGTVTGTTPTGTTPAVSVDIKGTVTGGGAPAAGAQITYTVTVTNTGAVTLTDPTATIGQGLTVTCPTGPVAPGASVICTVTGTHTVTQAEVDAGTVANPATVTAKAPGNTQVTGSDTDNIATSTTTGVSVDIAVGSIADPDSNGTEAGDQITYVYTVTNTGAVTLHDPTVATGLGLTVSCPPGPVVPGGSVTCTVSGPYTVTQADVNAGSVTNTATATGMPPTGAAVTSTQDSVTTQTATRSVVGVGVVGVVDDNDGNGTDAGDVITYTYTVTNNGTVPLTGVGVVDSIPGDPVCQAATLAPGESTTCTATYTITQADVDAGVGVTDQVTVTGTPPAGPVVTGTGTTTTPTGTTPAVQVQLTGTVAGGGTPAVGDQITYAVTVLNTGAVTLTDPTVTIGLGLTVTCPTGPVAPGASVTCTVSGPYTVTQADVDAGSVANSATVTATAPGSAQVSDSGAATTATATPAPGLAVDKVAGAPVDVNKDGVSDAGDTITYTFTVTNTGGVTLSDVKVLDPMFSSVPCLVTVLAPGATTTCTATHTVTAAEQASGTVNNTATSSAVSPGQVLLVSAPDSTTTAVVGGSTGISMDKKVSGTVDVDNDGQVDAGDTVTWEFLVANTGTVGLSQVSVSDPQLVAAGVVVTCPQATLAAGASTTCRSGVATITEVAEQAGRIVNTATATGTNPSGLVATAQDSATLAVAKHTKAGSGSGNGDDGTGAGAGTGTGASNGGITVDDNTGGTGDTGGTELPNTGSEVRPWMPIGGVLLVLAGLLLVTRRRRTSED